MSQIEFTEVLSEHDEKREIVLDDTVKANQSYQFKNLVEQKTGNHILSRMFDIGHAIRELQIVMTFT